MSTLVLLRIASLPYAMLAALDVPAATRVVERLLAWDERLEREAREKAEAAAKRKAEREAAAAAKAAAAQTESVS